MVRIIFIDILVVVALVKFFKWVNKSFPQYTSPDKTNKRKVW